MKVAAALFALCISTSPARAELTMMVSGDKEPSMSLKGTVTLSGNDVPALSKSTATINGNLIEVTTPGEGGSEQPVVLRGALLKAKLTESSFTGYVALGDNPYLAKIDDPEVEELIEINGGQTVSGHITEISQAGVKISERTIPFNQISRLCSPTIFEFSCPIATEVKPEGESYKSTSASMELKRTTSIDKKNKSGKRCCQFPPLMAPTKKQKKEGGGHHIHIIIPI